MQKLAMKTAKKHTATLILANDPDTDRLAMVERDSPSSETWDIFTGNEIGALLGWWLFKNYTEKHPNYDGKPFLFNLLSLAKHLILQKKISFRFFF